MILLLSSIERYIYTNLASALDFYSSTLRNSEIRRFLCILCTVTIKTKHVKQQILPCRLNRTSILSCCFSRKGNVIFAEYVAVCGLMLFQKGCITQHNAEFFKSNVNCFYLDKVYYSRFCTEKIFVLKSLCQ